MLREQSLRNLLAKTNDRFLSVSTVNTLMRDTNDRT